jgi:hypothetical protein
MTIEESMEAHDLNPHNKGDVAEYARMLLSGELVHGGVPEDLRGDAVSLNSLCEWDRKKAFANKAFHDVSFETVSKLFEGNRPGFQVLFGDIDAQGSGKTSLWGKDVRDFVVAKIGGDNFYVVKVDREHTVSGRIRLVTAFRLKKDVVLRLLKDRGGVLSSRDVHLLVSRARVRSSLVFASPLRHDFLSGGLSLDEAISLLASNYGMGESAALDCLDGWLKDISYNSNNKIEFF